MRIAIVHDMIVCRGGAERVLLYFSQALPDAPIFTTAYTPETSYPEFKNLDVRATWFNKIVASENAYKKLYFPLGLIAASQVDVRDYDLVLLSTTHGAKYAKFDPKAFVISYCYTPFRLAWNPHSYNQVAHANPLKRLLYQPVIHCLKTIDYRSAQRANEYWAMTHETADRISETYHKNVSLIMNPPVDCNRYQVSKSIGDYYLVVSRLEAYKKVDLVIKAFNRLGLPLKIVGRGTQSRALHALAKSNIEFIENIGDLLLSQLYAECKALIFPQHEDYGITPLEACASGRPVIAYRRGGVLETMVPYEGDAKKATALFFDHQEVHTLCETIETYERLSFDPSFIRRHALKFDVPQFIDKTRSSIESRVQQLVNGIDETAATLT